MEELRKFQSSAFDTIARSRLVEDQDTFLELTGKIRELQNDSNCMNDSKDFQDAESIRSGNSHLTSRSVSFPPLPIPEGMLSRSTGMPSRKDGWCIGKRFCRSSCVFYSTLPAGIESMEIQAYQNRFTHQRRRRMRIKHQFRIRDASPDRQPKIQSLLVREILQRLTEQTNNDRTFFVFHFDKFPTPATFTCWKMRFKIEVCTCSQFLLEAMHWIKEVEMVDSVDDLMSSSSTRGIQMPIFCTRCEDCFSTEQDHPYFSFKRSNPLFADLWVKTSDKRLPRIYFYSSLFCCSWIVSS